MKKIPTFHDFMLNENRGGADEYQYDMKKIKKGAIERLSSFFGVSPYSLSSFNFDGKDNIKALAKALNSTSDIGAENYYHMAIKLAKQDQDNEDY